MEVLNKDELKERIEKDSKLIFSKHIEEKYRKPAVERSIKFQFTDFIDFTVFQQSTKKLIKIKTYLFLPNEKNYKDSSEYKGIIFIFHGMGSYAANESFVAKSFSEKGFAVALYDNRGHGFSEGVRGDIESFKSYISDAKDFIIKTELFLKQKYSNKKNNVNTNEISKGISEKSQSNNNSSLSTNFISNKFIYGTSLGGLLCFHLSKELPKYFKGVFFMSPAFGVNIGCTLKLLINIIGFCCPTTTLPPPPSGESPAFKNPYYTENPDKIFLSTPTRIGTLKTSLEYMDKANSHFEEYDEPFVLVIPGVDKIIPPLSQYKLYERAKSKDKDCWYYENMWHAVFGEEEIVEIIDRIAHWINERI